MYQNNSSVAIDYFRNKQNEGETNKFHILWSCPTFGMFKIHVGWGQIRKQKSEYDQEIPQSQTADKPMAPRGRATQQ